MKITVEFDSTKPAEMVALTEMLTKATGQIRLSEVAPPKEDKPNPPSKTRKKAEAAKEKSAGKIWTIDKVRGLLAEKLDEKGEDARAQLKDKLESFGASNISTLPEENYEEFVAFLTEL